jgi:hypothetical protein
MKPRNFSFFNSHDLQVVVNSCNLFSALAKKELFLFWLKPLKVLSLLHDLKVVANKIILQHKQFIPKFVVNRF